MPLSDFHFGRRQRDVRECCQLGGIPNGFSHARLPWCVLFVLCLRMYSHSCSGTGTTYDSQGFCSPTKNRCTKSGELWIVHSSSLSSTTPWTHPELVLFTSLGNRVAVCWASSSSSSGRAFVPLNGMLAVLVQDDMRSLRPAPHVT
jgi:hypothetical protein